jgi:hypothetical protein
MQKLRLICIKIMLGIILILCLTTMVSADENSSRSSDSSNTQSSSAAITKSVVVADLNHAMAEDDQKKQKGLEDEYQEVDLTGAFQYQYPIDIPLGTHGMVPKLKLFYNSNCSNGMLGIGWSLVGIPKIERDFTYPVNYDNTDHFIYNGERLVADSSSCYHPAKESYERIEFKNQNSSSSYWVITQKDGTKMYFGYRAVEHTADIYGRVEGIGLMEVIKRLPGH